MEKYPAEIKFKKNKDGEGIVEVYVSKTDSKPFDILLGAFIYSSKPSDKSISWAYKMIELHEASLKDDLL